MNNKGIDICLINIPAQCRSYSCDAAPPTYAIFVPGCKWRHNIRLCF